MLNYYITLTLKKAFLQTEGVHLLQTEGEPVRFKGAKHRVHLLQTERVPVRFKGASHLFTTSLCNVIL